MISEQQALAIAEEYLGELGNFDESRDLLEKLLLSLGIRVNWVNYSPSSLPFHIHN